MEQGIVGKDIKSTPTSSVRNLGIDCLRIVSMLMVVILHTLGRGGILTNAATGSTQFNVAWLLEIACYCAVDCYALISGYVGIYSKFRFSKLILLWLQVLFYVILISCVFAFASPQKVTVSAILSAFTGSYWYIQAYTGMFLFMPLLNAGIRKLNSKQLKAISVCVILFFVFWPRLLNQGFYATVGLNEGYSVLWLCILYFLGGAMQKCGFFEAVNKKGVLLYILCIFGTWVLYIKGKTNLVSYISPTVFFAAIGLVAFFANIKFKNKGVKKIISLLAPATLGVYIIHTNPLMLNAYLTQGFALPFLQHRTLVVIALVLGFAIAVYILCSLLDLIRIRLFGLLKIREKLSPIDKIFMFD